MTTVKRNTTKMSSRLEGWKDYKNYQRTNSKKIRKKMTINVKINTI